MTQRIDETVKYIAARSLELKDKFTTEFNSKIEFVDIFCQSKEEYRNFSAAAKELGPVVQKTPTGFTSLLDEAIETDAGSLRLVKVRKPDRQRSERGDAEFRCDYPKFKSVFVRNPKFELVKRPGFEMLRLSDPQFDVMVCFSSIPFSQKLGLSL